MPTVRTYGQRQVALAPIPGVRKQAHLTAEALGAGTEIAKSRASEEMGQFGATAARIGINEYAEIRQQGKQYQQSVERLELTNNMSRWKSERLYTQGTGALAQEGKNAFGLPEQVGGEFDQYASELEATISDPETRLWFAGQKLQEGAQIDMTLRRHVLGESQKYEAAQTQALKQNQANEAIVNALDEPAVTRAINKGVIAIQEHAGRMGQSPDEIKDQVRDYQSAVLSGVIKTLIDSDQTTTAQKRYDDAKHDGLLDGKALHDLGKDLQEGHVKVDAAKLSDDILATPEYDTLAKQQEEVKRRTDAMEDQKKATAIRDATNERLEHQDNLKDRARRLHEEAVVNAVYTKLTKNGGDWSSVDAREIEDMGAHVASLRAYAKSLSSDDPVKDDLPTYYALEKLMYSDNPKDQKMFREANLLTGANKLSQASLKRFMDFQAQLREGKKPIEIAGLRENGELVKDTASQYGLDPTAKKGTPEADAMNQLQRMLDVKVEEFETDQNKKPTTSDKMDMIHGILSMQSGTKGSMWNIFRNTLPGTNLPLTDTTKRLVDLTIKDVPPNERALIEESLRGAKRPVSDATVLNAYIDQQTIKAGVKQYR